MLERWCTEKLEKIINRVPAAGLLGPRQVGKTTLAREIAKKRSSVYLDLESSEDLLKLRDPFSFLSRDSDKLIILNEIHRFPDLFMILRGLIDQNRRAGKKAGQFLLLFVLPSDCLRTALFVLFFAKMAPAICSAVPDIGGMILGLRPIPTK